MPNEQTFMLKVRGESMIKAGICDGDRILVQQQSHVGLEGSLRIYPFFSRVSKWE